MYSTFLSVALFAAPAFAAFAINSPALKQCEPSRISWEPAVEPYNLIVVPASDRCGDALVEIGDFNKTSIMWTTNLPAGTKVILSLVDATDEEAWSNEITIADSDDDSCLPGRSAAPSSASSTPAAAASSTPASTPNTTPGSTGGSTGGSDDTDSNGPNGLLPVGAANAGTNPLGSGAINARQASAPAIAITALAAVFALSL
ncbi:hypothetical protein CVT24_000749 [Panaeolus cyanescens]|uniref:Uncharacterized protein n=1 Tax=Panaeolus cyanescens TaxID=181874 RepID=A0A409YCQ7_9AGAR|nr:hypothetical protein CVT24_000749 [Panaeolus cyanescens]